MNRQELKFVLSAVVLLVGLALLGRGAHIFGDAALTTNLYFYEQSINRNVVDAIVTERRSVPDNSSNNHREYAIYRFSINVPGKGEVSFVSEDRIDRSGHESLQMGQHVAVQYVAEHPEISEIIGTHPDIKEAYLIEKFAVPILSYFAAGITLFLVGLVIGITSFVSILLSHP
jgi:hypothetical protein